MDQPRRIGDVPIYRPFPGVYHIQAQPGVFVTLLTGCQGALLIDTGLGLGDLRKTVDSLTDKPLTVVNTHGHIDHFGGNYQFDEVYIKEADLATARNSLVSLEFGGLAPEWPALDSRDPRNWPPDVWYARSFGHAKPLDPERVFDLGGLIVTQAPLPSHTPGMTGFYVEELGLLLGGDSVCTLVNLCLPGASSVEEHLRVLRSAEALPFTHLLTSHSERLLDRRDFDCFLSCACAYDVKKTVRYRDDLYLNIKGRMFVYEDDKGRVGIIVSN